MSNDKTVSVRLSDLAIGYVDRGRRRTVAEGLNAAIRPGELTCLIGANGVGKSTLLRTLSAFQPKLGGRVDVGGRDLADYSPASLSRVVSVVLTERPAVRSMTARQLVSMGRAPYTGFWGRCTAADWHIVGEAMELVGISSLAERDVDTLSDGERQKVMIAKALAQQAPIVYLDEPTAFLDFPSKVETMLLLRRISHGQQKTVFLSTHDLELALQTADSLWLMDRGEGLVTGTPRELAAQGTLSRFVERRGIRFDTTTMTIQIEKDQT